MSNFSDFSHVHGHFLDPLIFGFSFPVRMWNSHAPYFSMWKTWLHCLTLFSFWEWTLSSISLYPLLLSKLLWSCSYSFLTFSIFFPGWIFSVSLFFHCFCFDFFSLWALESLLLPLLTLFLDVAFLCPLSGLLLCTPVLCICGTPCFSASSVMASRSHPSLLPLSRLLSLVLLRNYLFFFFFCFWILYFISHPIYHFAPWDP